jgi:lipopolysaccharide heptosyltransferase III
VTRAPSGAALAIHPGALGDVLLAVPALRALRRRGVRLTLAAQPRIARLLQALDETDAAIDFDALGLSAFFTESEAPRWPAVDHVVCWFGARDPRFAARLRRVAPGAVVAPSIGDGEVWRHLLDTVGGPADRRAARVPEALVRQGRAALSACGCDERRGVLLIHPGAGSPAKSWATDGFVAALAAAGDAQLVLHRGPADAGAVSALAAQVPRAAILDAPELTTLAGTLACCVGYVGNDSGVSHLAAAVGTPSIILYAAFNLAWRPWMTTPRVLTVTMERAAADEVEAVRVALRELLR